MSVFRYLVPITGWQGPLCPSDPPTPKQGTQGHGQAAAGDPQGGDPSASGQPVPVLCHQRLSNHTCTPKKWTYYARLCQKLLINRHNFSGINPPLILVHQPNMKILLGSLLSSALVLRLQSCGLLGLMSWWFRLIGAVSQLPNWDFMTMSFRKMLNFNIFIHNYPISNWLKQKVWKGKEITRQFWKMVLQLLP